MANSALTEDDQKALLAAFQHVESHEMGDGTHEKFLGLADALADRFGVAKAHAGAAHHCGCGHH